MVRIFFWKNHGFFFKFFVEGKSTIINNIFALLGPIMPGTTFWKLWCVFKEFFFKKKDHLRLSTLSMAQLSLHRQWLAFWRDKSTSSTSKASMMWMPTGSEATTWNFCQVLARATIVASSSLKTTLTICPTDWNALIIACPKNVLQTGRNYQMAVGRTNPQHKIK